MSTLQCRTRKLYLDTIYNKENITFWMTGVQGNNVIVPFKMDTGAKVTAISEDTLQILGQLEISKPHKKLRMWPKWCAPRLDEQPQRNIISEAAQM